MPPASMKKFCNKISKQQWRVTVPNLNFKKSIAKDDLSVPGEKVKTSVSGCYDVEQAEKNFERSHSVPVSTYLESDSSESEPDDLFEDAQTMLERSTEFLNSTPLAEEETDLELYTDVPCNRETSKVLTEHNGKYEYDVPKISFKFFEKASPNKLPEEDDPPVYEAVNPKPIVSPKHKSEMTIVLEQNEKDELKAEKELNTEKEIKTKTEEFKTNQTEKEETNINDSKTSIDELKKSIEDISKLPVDELECKTNHLNVDSKELTLSLTKILDDFCTGSNVIKSGSDPNIVLRTIEEESEDEGLYKVPKSLQKNRLSMSMNDFNPDTIPNIDDNKDSSIEHISCSQVIVKPLPENDNNTSSNNLDYCKARSKLPLRIRRATFLKKPRNKAADTWKGLKTKVNKVISEHSSPNSPLPEIDREKLANNIEGMYKTSRDKCRKMLKNTGKMFKANKPKDVQDNQEDNTSQIVKNDAFFDKVKLKASDIEYKFNESSDRSEKCDTSGETELSESLKKQQSPTNTADSSKEEFEFPKKKSGFRRSKVVTEGQNGFDDIRRYVKQGGDFCKELAVILQERSEAELQYAKSLSKLSGKLSKACREGVGGLNEAWKSVAQELEARAEGHRLIGTTILEEAAKPLKTLTENQHRARKQVETVVDKAAKSLSDWRATEAKIKKHSHTCARENEKLQDALLDNRITRSASLIQLAHLNNKNVSEKDTAKMEGKKRKAEDAVKKADIEYYTTCLRAERARLDWETAVLRGASSFQNLEDERLSNLKTVLNTYLQHSNELGPRLLEAVDRLRTPASEAEPAKDLSTFVSLRQSSQQVSEQLLPDFYCEHITLAMNRERRKQALIKLMYLIRQDIERERKSKGGLENLSHALKQTPSFGSDDSQQTFAERFYHMKSMLTYLEGARYKVHSALCELEGRSRNGHPLAPHINITRDKSGLQQSVLKVPQWLREQWGELEQSPVSDKSTKSDINIHDVDLPDPDWSDRGTADGNSNQPDSDFDEFSSQGSASEVCQTDETPVQPIAKCKALYPYTPNLPDELPLHPGDVLSVYRQQDDGWWLGECNGSVGIFPATYVETITV